jgi:hypothetical protein
MQSLKHVTAVPLGRRGAWRLLYVLLLISYYTSHVRQD